MEAATLECPNSSSEKRYFPESLDSSDGDEEGILACEDLELNPFDGLPYSSRYYKLLKERGPAHSKVRFRREVVSHAYQICEIYHLRF